MGYRIITQADEINMAGTLYHRPHCDRIVTVAQERGFVIVAREAEKIWEAHSDTLDDGWMGLPGRDYELWEIIEDAVKAVCPVSG